MDMYTYIFRYADKAADKDKFDVEEFNRVASTKNPINPSETGIFNNGDIAMYSDKIPAGPEDPLDPWPEGRYYIYNNSVWMLNVIPNNSKTLAPGLAVTFREDLNNNFSQIKD